MVFIFFCFFANIQQTNHNRDRVARSQVTRIENRAIILTNACATNRRAIIRIIRLSIKNNININTHAPRNAIKAKILYFFRFTYLPTYGKTSTIRT